MTDDQIILRKGIYASVTVLHKNGGVGKPSTKVLEIIGKSLGKVEFGYMCL